MPSTVVALSVDFKSDKVCFGNATTLVSLSTPRDSIFKLLWDINGDGKFGDVIGDTIHVTFSFSGYHNVGLKALTFSGETKAVYHIVAVGKLTVDFSMVASCSHQPTIFNNQSAAIADTLESYTWNFGDGSPASHDRDPVYTYLVPGDYQVKLRVNTVAGCSDSVSKTFTIDTPPEVSLTFIGDTVLLPGDSVIVTVTNAADSVLWSTGEKTREVVIKKAGSVWVKTYSGVCYGQKNFHTTMKNTETEPVIATLFTPNGDGFNDRWEILNLSSVGPCDVKIFSRTGERVLADPDYANNWDGTYKGRLLTNDTYYYFVRCFDNVDRQGTVNILK